MSQLLVAILRGSASDLPVIQTAIDALKQLNVSCVVKITSTYSTLNDDAFARGKASANVDHSKDKKLQLKLNFH